MIQQIINFAFASGKFRCGHSLYSSWFACIILALRTLSIANPRAREFVFVRKLWGPKKVTNLGARNTEMTCSCPYIAVDYSNPKKNQKSIQSYAKMALLCKKHGRSAPCFTFSGPWLETGLKF